LYHSFISILLFASFREKRQFLFLGITMPIYFFTFMQKKIHAEE